MFKVGEKVKITSFPHVAFGRCGIVKTVNGNGFYYIETNNLKFLCYEDEIERVDDMDISERLSEVIKENQNLKQQISEQNIKLNKIQADVRREQGVSDEEFGEAIKHSPIIDEDKRYEIWGLINYFDLFAQTSLSEFVSKYKKYKDKQNEIKVGDEISPNDYKNVKAIVTYISDYCYEAWVLKNGGVGTYTLSHEKIKNWHKTGRHFDEVETLLSKLKGSN